MLCHEFTGKVTKATHDGGGGGWGASLTLPWFCPGVPTPHLPCAHTWAAVTSSFDGPLESYLSSGLLWSVMQSDMAVGRDWEYGSGITGLLQVLSRGGPAKGGAAWPVRIGGCTVVRGGQDPRGASCFPLDPFLF